MSYKFASRQIANGASDPDASKVVPIPCSGATTISIGGTCASAGGNITVRLVFADESNTLVVGCSSPITLMSGSTADWGTHFLGVPNDEFWSSPVAMCAAYAYLKVDSSKGAWTINAMITIPPGTTPPF